MTNHKRLSYAQSYYRESGFGSPHGAPVERLTPSMGRGIGPLNILIDSNPLVLYYSLGSLRAGVRDSRFWLAEKRKRDSGLGARRRNVTR